MEQLIATMDLSFLIPAVIFTLLAIIVTTRFFNSNRSPSAVGLPGVQSEADNSQHQTDANIPTPPSQDASEKLTEEGLPSAMTKEGRSPDRTIDPGASGTGVMGQAGAEIKHVSTDNNHGDDAETSPGFTAVLSSSGPPEETDPTELIFDPTTESEDQPALLTFPSGTFLETDSTGLDLSPPPGTKGAAALSDMEDVDAGLKYVPGVVRMSQLEKMMTREELEEEQRVQQEQLAAIFQLLAENKETFGEVSAEDVEEQLRLYSI